VEVIIIQVFGTFCWKTVHRVFLGNHKKLKSQKKYPKIHGMKIFPGAEKHDEH